MSKTTTETQQQQLTTFNTTTSSSPIEIPRGPVDAFLTFYAPPTDGSAPFNYVEKPPPGEPQRNFTEDTHSVTINDIRGRESDYDFNVSGFGVLQNQPPSAEKEFTSDDSIKQNYYPEVERLLLENVPGAKRIFFFDHTVRRSHPDAPRAPVNRAHIDQTKQSAEKRVEYHMGSEAPELLKSRVRLINVWRPLNGPVVASPLAFADSRSVSDHHLEGVQHRYPHRVGETAGVKYSAEGKWHYLSGMRNGERILLQCYDSEDGARTPHSAFVDPRTQEDWLGRESIEVRALVFG
jgi:hypothetical protein